MEHEHGNDRPSNRSRTQVIERTRDLKQKTFQECNDLTGLATSDLSHQGLNRSLYSNETFSL
jgi:hypothetical protein